MLGAADFGKVKAEYDKAIDTLGVSATWTPVVQPGAPAAAPKAVTVGFKITTDEVLINAYGVGARIITMKTADGNPAKFDQFVVQGERYTVDQVDTVFLNGQALGHRCVIRGK